MVDLYGSAARYARLKAAMVGWPVAAATLELLQDYLETKLEHLSASRRLADLGVLQRLFLGSRYRAPYLPRPNLRSWTLPDVVSLATRLRTEAQTGRVKRETYRVVRRHILALYRHAVGPEPAAEHTALLSQLRARLIWPADVQESTSIDRYYTYDEFRRILAVARRPQERALLSVAWETTSRPNEYLSLRVGDVTETPHGFTLRAHVSKQVGGRTHSRPLYVLAFRAEFASFWAAHPWRHDARRPLFYRDDCARHRGHPLGPTGASKILRKYDTLSGVAKRGTLYFLRHGGYTHKVLQGMKDELAGADMGWTPGSGQRRRYTHLTDQDVFNERLRLAGVRFAAEVAPTLQARICPACNQANSPVATHCTTCGQRLSITEVLRELDDLKASQAALVERTVRELLARRGVEPLRGAVPRDASTSTAP